MASIKSMASEALKSVTPEGLLSSLSMSTLRFIFGTKNLEDWKQKATIIIGIEAMFCFVALLDLISDKSLSEHGIHPRQITGLPGIVLSPLLHRSLLHFIVNAVPFAILGGLVMIRQRGIELFSMLTAAAGLGSGALVWAFGQSGTSYVGSSSLIFAYFGYLLVFGILVQEIRAALVSMGVFFIYGSLLFGSSSETSWEGQMFGFVIGCVFATMHTRGSLPGFTEDKDYTVANDSEKESLISGPDNA